MSTKTIAGTHVKECGCTPDGVYVEFCPMHAATLGLLEAAEMALTLLYDGTPGAFEVFEIEEAHHAE